MKFLKFLFSLFALISTVGTMNLHQIDPQTLSNQLLENSVSLVLDSTEYEVLLGSNEPEAIEKLKWHAAQLGQFEPELSSNFFISTF